MPQTRTGVRQICTVLTTSSTPVGTMRKGTHLYFELWFRFLQFCTLQRVIPIRPVQHLILIIAIRNLNYLYVLRGRLCIITGQCSDFNIIRIENCDGLIFNTVLLDVPKSREDTVYLRIRLLIISELFDGQTLVPPNEAIPTPNPGLKRIEREY